jgi:TatD DNase family protein
MYIDSHAHLSAPPILPLMEGIIQRARQVNIIKIVNICTHPEALREGIALASLYPEIVNAGSTTPHDVEREGESAFSIFAEAARLGHLVAVGETGLDYHYEHSPKELQKIFLIRYLELALECHLPVIFHCRDAFSDLFSVTDAHYKGGSAVLHCFTGTIEEAEQVIERGWYLSLSGILTFKKSQMLREVAKKIPLSQILIETDAPYLAPQSHRGQMNEPSYLPATAACLAEAKGLSLDEVARATSENAKRFFRFCI